MHHGGACACDADRSRESNVCVSLSLPLASSYQCSVSGREGGPGEVRGSGVLHWLQRTVRVISPSSLRLSPLLHRRSVCRFSTSLTSPFFVTRVNVFLANKRSSILHACTESHKVLQYVALGIRENVKFARFTEDMKFSVSEL